MASPVELRKYMLHKPITVKPEMTVFEAAHQILSHSVSGVCVVDDDENMELALENEKQFMTRKFKLSCFMCGNSSLGLLSLAADNQNMIKVTLYGYIITNILKRVIKEKAVDVNFDQAKELAKNYNDSLLGQTKIAI